MSLADLKLYKVYCCYFDGENLQVIHMEEDLKITRAFLGGFPVVFLLR